VTAIDALRSRGWDISDGALRDGLARTRWSGRLEVIDRHPIVLVDGAHNPAGLERTLATVDRLAKDRVLVIVFGAMKDKDLPAMLAQIRALGTRVIFSPIDWHRAASPSELAAQYSRPDQRAAIEPEIANSASSALTRARQLAGRDGIVLVCGSLYLVGEVIELQRRNAVAVG
jgi:dihydrofolate synthase/folylpolyglutamate synthase